MVVHVSCLRWVPGVTADQVEAVRAGLAGLPGVVAGLRGYRFGPDAGLAEGNWDFAVAAELESPEAYRAYAEHPAHQAVLADLIRPILAARVAVQLVV